MQKKKKMGTRIPGTRIRPEYSGSPNSVSDPNPKLQYPSIIRICSEYKNTRIRIRKNRYLYYSYLVPDGYTRPVFTPSSAGSGIGPWISDQLKDGYAVYSMWENSLFNLS
jgi:hypothetical protein